MFQGVHTALCTPFINSENPEVDFDKFEKLIEDQINSGINGLVPTGTTGESPTLSHNEQLKVIEFCVQKVKESPTRKPFVIAGTGSNSTQEALEMSQKAEKFGVDALLLVTPYYNKPNQEGLFQHFKTIADAVKIPVMLYNIPGRSVVEIEIDTIKRLQKTCPNISSIKEAGGSITRVAEMRKALPAEFEILCGDDNLTLDFMENGAIGVVSVISHLIPEKMLAMTKAQLEGKNEIARKIYQQQRDLFEDFLKIDANPLPIKSALAMQDRMSESFRLPLTKLSPEKKAELKLILTKNHLL